MRTAFALLFLIISSSGLEAAITIDDFSAGPLDVTLTAASPSLNQSQEVLPESAVLGGIRRHVTVIDSPLNPNSEAKILIDTGDETYRVTTNANLEAYTLSYGLRTLAEGSADQALDLDLTGFAGLRFDVIASQLSDIATVSFRSGVNEGTIKSAFDIVSLPMSNTAYSVFVPFTTFFLSRIDITDVDSITLASSVPAGFDITLDGIFIVPEPNTSVLLMLASVLTMVDRQRRWRF